MHTDRDEAGPLGPPGHGLQPGAVGPATARHASYDPTRHRRQSHAARATILHLLTRVSPDKLVSLEMPPTGAPATTDRASPRLGDQLGLAVRAGRTDFATTSRTRATPIEYVQNAGPETDKNPRPGRFRPTLQNLRRWVLQPRGCARLLARVGM